MDYFRGQAPFSNDFWSYNPTVDATSWSSNWADKIACKVMKGFVFTFLIIIGASSYGLSCHNLKRLQQVDTVRIIENIRKKFRFYLGFSGPNERDYKDKVVSEAFDIRE